MKQFFYIGIGKTKIFIKSGAGDGVNLKIVESSKYALFCDAKTSGQHSKFQAVVCFQCISKHGADQGNHFVVVTMLKGFIEWNIIFINENDDFLLEMFGKEQGYIAQGSRKGFIWHGKNTIFYLYIAAVKVLFRVCQICTFSQKWKSGRFHADDIFHGSNSVCVCLPVSVMEMTGNCPI